VNLGRLAGSAGCAHSFSILVVAEYIVDERHLMPELTHLDERGRARMVDVSAKGETVREATARGRVTMQPQTLALVREGGLGKGDVLAVARVAGIMGAKKTSELIPLCHPLPITGVEVAFELDDEASAVEIVGIARVVGKTGVEMEALTAVSVAALAIYDMCKAVDKDMVLEGIRLVHKAGGKSGEYHRPGEAIDGGDR
jgi:cyclic pyranopterin phosphate synthase